MILALVGESASGKTTTANMFAESDMGFKKVITYTTRPPREGEKDGIDYYFISDQKFEYLANKNLFLEKAKYRGWNYGSAIDLNTKDNLVVVLTPAGARALKKASEKVEREDVFIVYIKVDRRIRLIKLLGRGDDIDESYRRNLSDVGMFDGFENEADYTVYNDYFIKNPKKVFEEIKNVIGVNMNG